jgi:signal transduction histidine kinase/ActR/RegA family two-component response regulator
MTGHEAYEAVGRDIRDVFDPVNCSGEMHYMVRKILDSKGEADLSKDDLVVLRGDEMLNIACSCSPIRNSNADFIGIVIVFRDVTRQRKYEEEMVRSSKLDAISTMAGGIAHDFNNVLTAIVGNISLAQMKTHDPGTVSGILSDMESATYRAKDLTQQMLTFSKGGAPIKTVSSIRTLLKEVVSFHLSGSNVKVETDIEDNLWNASIDEGQISQVIGNLVINAKQAMPEGGRIWVTAMNVVSSSPDSSIPEGQYLRISVRDEGCGIPPEHIRRIFDPFYTTKPEGNGLGLASSASVVKNHDGSIEVESSPGEGSEFIIYLPATQEQPAAESEQGSDIIRGTARVLFMDDEDIILKSIGGLMSAMGYTVDCVHNGFEAISSFRRAMARGTPYDLVISDLTIPGSMGGKDMIQRLLEMAPDVRVIATSGYSNDPIMSNYRSFGFSDIIIKPYSISVLSRVMARVLRGEKVDRGTSIDMVGRD